MDSNLQAVELPAFELDCRDWLVATPEDGSVPDELDGMPVIAVLSTVLIGAADLHTGSAVLSIGLLDQPVDAVRTNAESPAAELIDYDSISGRARYVVPAPAGNLALLAEFNAEGLADEDLMGRFDRLMSSFRWASSECPTGV